ncbi:MAG TPA: extracellular solute-binding protein [Geminicoccaceae bacterium]|nr:extracellular solute-binding protein [Geminicoccus sp.]HMU52476.1 extracellular solute-binding protein [Geminicoccaceae bacterium]
MLLSRRQVLVAAGVAALVPVRWRPARAAAGAHGIAMHGDLKYGPGFGHFDYVNPEAPKGGTLSLSTIGNFDSMNPFILRGTPAAGLGLAFETLTVQSLDEPFSEYGLIAQTIEVAEDWGSVSYELHPDARWHDGTPITPADVIFSFETLKAKGHPRYRAYYANVARAEQTGERRVTFTFDGTGANRELPLIMGQLSIIPKHYYEGRDFEQVDLDIPLGSGPYRIKSFVAGRSTLSERVPDYWGAELPVNKGRNNFDAIRYEYFRDADVALEAFKAGQYDLRVENSAKRWATGYTGPAIERGLIKVEKVKIEPPARMQGFIFNLRRPQFHDRRVREAIGYAFDFEWTNRTLMYDQYVRLTSFFHGEPSLMAAGDPSPAELALLEPYRDKLPSEVFGPPPVPPRTDGTGNIRDNLRQALRLLREAGWEVEDGKLVETASGRAMAFEILGDDPSDERIAGPFVQNLKRLGIDARIRVVDPAQYQNRTDDFDFDMITDIWAQSASPGNEQRDFWGSAAADVPGSRNTIGIEDPVVDAMIDAVIRAESREALETACRALDRVLLWGFYLVPQFTDNGYRMAWWDKFGQPEKLPSEGPDLFAWWVDPARDRALGTGRQQIDTKPAP